MSQFSLFPEDELVVPPPMRTPPEEACENLKSAEHKPRAQLPDLEVQGNAVNDVQSFEENTVEVLAGERPIIGRARHTHRSARLFRPEPQVQSAGAWPAGLTWSAALAYTSLSPSQLRRWQRAGALSFRRVGRNGAKIVMRAELDRLLAQIFTPITTDITEDFDFG